MHSVEEFVETAFRLVGRDWREFVAIDERYFRPTEVDELRGDPSKIGRTLGWQPVTKFDELIRIMLEADLTEAGLDPDQHLGRMPELSE
jgi:GDPmannose 4,6-dehydratase